MAATTLERSTSGLILPSALGYNLANQEPVILSVTDGATFQNKPMRVNLTQSGQVEITTLQGLEGFAQMAAKRGDAERNRRLWTPNGDGQSSLIGNGLELSNVGVSLALKVHIDGNWYAILALRTTKTGEHLMLPSGYVDWHKFSPTREDQGSLGASTVLHNAAGEFVEEVTPVLVPGFSAGSRVRGDLVRHVLAEVCLSAGDHQILTNNGTLLYPGRYKELTYLPDVWSTLKLSSEMPFIHNVFHPTGVSIDGVQLSGVGFQIHMHTNSGQLIFGGVYSIGIEDFDENRHLLSLAHAENRAVTGDSPRARSLKQLYQSPLETVVNHNGLILCRLDPQGQFTPELFNFREGSLVRHPLIWDSTTLSDAFVPAGTVGDLGFSAPEGSIGYVDRGAISALDFFRRPQAHSRIPQRQMSWSGVSLPEAMPEGDQILSTAERAKVTIRDRLAQFMATSPEGFYSLPGITEAAGPETSKVAIMQALDRHRKTRGFVAPVPLDLSQPPYHTIFAGTDYHHQGPVIVGPSHLPRIFTGFEKPSKTVVEQRIAISAKSDNYGTMPGVETAYAGAIVSAVKPRVLLIIGEHRGILTDYLAQQAPDDCLIFTIDLPQSMYSMAGVTQVDRINQSYIRHSDDRIGEVWRTSSKPHKERIFGFLGDSTHDHSKWLFETLRGRCDLVVVDGNHERQSVVSDLVNAWDVLTPHGVVLLDDFDKPPRLKGVEYAVQEARQLFAEFPYLYKVSWARPAEPGKPEDPDNVNSNLALLIKSSDPSLLARRDDMRTRLQGKARKMEGI